jgi:hypothetical protein
VQILFPGFYAKNVKLKNVGILMWDFGILFCDLGFVTCGLGFVTSDLEFGLGIGIWDLEFKNSITLHPRIHIRHHTPDKEKSPYFS